MEYLGDSIEKIAVEKAGIIKKYVPVIYCGADERVSDVISEVAEKMLAKTVKVIADY